MKTRDRNNYTSVCVPIIAVNGSPSRSLAKFEEKRDEV